jgi:hypothetical protein
VQFAEATLSDAQAYDPRQDAQGLHTYYLWNDDAVHQVAERLTECKWVFAENNTERPFCTSDNPALIHGSGCHWLEGPRVFDLDMHLTLPLSPSWILYCMDPRSLSAAVKSVPSISPVTFTPELADHENDGQIMMSSRFVFANAPTFENAREFFRRHPDARDPRRARYRYHGPIESG